jgi:phosphoribosylformylglycinamidine synthase
MISRVEVLTTVFDSRAELRKKNKKIKSITLVDVYTIDKKLSLTDLNKIGSSVSNPVTQKFYIRSFGSPPSGGLINKFDWVIEIGFLPGVTDNIAHTAKQIVEDLLNIKFVNSEDVYSSQITFVTGNLNSNEIKQIASSLFNPLIQRVHIKNYEQFIKDSGMDMIVPKVILKQKPTITKLIECFKKRIE